jgi:hypothetical protein
VRFPLAAAPKLLHKRHVATRDQRWLPSYQDGVPMGRSATWRRFGSIARRSLFIHRETKTFSRRAAAGKWARALEVELEDPAAMVRACAGDGTLASLIRWYIDAFNKSPSGRE